MQALLSALSLLTQPLLLSEQHTRSNCNIFSNCCPGILQVQNDFGPSKLFWTETNCFGRVQIILDRFNLDFSGLIDWFSTKIVCTVQNHFGSIGDRP